MFIFSRYGFLSCISIVTKGEDGKPNFDHMAVDAQKREHLSNIIAFASGAVKDGVKYASMQEVADAQILERVGTDYAYRIIISQHAFTGLMHWLAGSVDYSDLQSAAYKTEGTQLYANAVDLVRSVMHDFRNAAYTPPSAPHRSLTEIYFPIKSTFFNG
jgi:hypothetical protein